MSGRWKGLGLLLALAGLWEISARYWVQGTSWPPFTEVVAAMGQGLVGGGLTPIVLSSLYRMAAGFLIGCGLGIATGLFMGVFEGARRTLEPAFELMRPIPSPALIPPLILILGVDDALKIFVVALVVYWPMAISASRGVASVEATLTDVAATFRVYGLRRFRTVTFPALLPFLIAGMRVSLALAFAVTVVAEMIAGSSGVGFYILQMQRSLQPEAMYAAILVLAVIGYALNRGAVAGERRILHWYFQGANR